MRYVGFSWSDSRATPTGIASQKVDRTTTILRHRWQPFVGIGAEAPSSPPGTATKGVTLAAGNYEWPFELLLPGETCESVEGLPEANITYKLKATVTRGKLAYDLHAYKRLRIIRSLESSALEFLHAMSVENIWPNKVEYSIVVPRKAVVFGSSIPLEARFTPLLKSLEVGDVNVKLIEVHDFALYGAAGQSLRHHKKEKEVSTWVVPMNREEHWRDMIDDTGQEGWILNTDLDLPKRLGRCLQDVNAHGIKIRHKLKLVVTLRNPDGHVSELRATLPVTIFISPNMPLDEEGNLVRQRPRGSSTDEITAIAPPVYGEHVLDELYGDVDASGLQTPGMSSGVNSPFYAHSRTGSAENLVTLAPNTAVPPAALSSRLQSVSVEPSQHGNPQQRRVSGSGFATPHQAHDHAQSVASPPASLSRRTSGEHTSGSNTPEHVDYPDLSALSKVPSYHTAVKTPVRPLSLAEGSVLPNYQTAMSAPGSPTTSRATMADHLGLAIVPEVSHDRRDGTAPAGNVPLSRERRRSSLGSSVLYSHSHSGDSDEHRRLHLMRARDRIV